MADAPAGKADEDWRDDAEADRLRDEAFRRLLDAPPKPKKGVKLGETARGKAAGRHATPLREDAASGTKLP